MYRKVWSLIYFLPVLVLTAELTAFDGRIKFSPDRNFAVRLSKKGDSVEVLDGRDFHVITRFPARDFSSNPADEVAFMYDSQRLVIRPRGGDELIIRDIDGDLVGTIPLGASINSMDVSALDNTIVASNILGQVSAWNGANGQLLASLDLSELNLSWGMELGIQISPVSQRVLLSTNDDLVLWELDTNSVVQHQIHHENVEFNFDGSRILVHASDRVALLDSHGEFVRALGLGTNPEEGPYVHAEFVGDVVLTVVERGKGTVVRVIDMEGNVLHEIAALYAGLNPHVRLSPDGERLFIADLGTGILYLHDLCRQDNCWPLISIWDVNNSLSDIDFRSDGHLYLVSRDGRVASSETYLSGRFGNLDKGAKMKSSDLSPAIRTLVWARNFDRLGRLLLLPLAPSVFRDDQYLNSNQMLRDFIWDNSRFFVDVYRVIFGPDLRAVVDLSES